MTIIDPATLLQDDATLSDWLHMAELYAKPHYFGKPHAYGKVDELHALQARRIVALIEHIRADRLLRDAAASGK